MATTAWLDGSASWTTSTNWSNSAIPTGSDSVILSKGTTTITTVIGAGSGVNYQEFVITGEFEGAIGNSSNVMYLGTVVAPIEFDGQNCTEAWLGTDTGDTNSINVRNTNGGNYGLVLYTGTWSDVRITNGLVRIGAASTVTALNCLKLNGYPHAYILSGATVTTENCGSGKVSSYAAHGTINVYAGGLHDHMGESTYNVTTVNIYGGTFKFGSRGGTITTCNLYDGLLELDAGYGDARTISTLNLYGGTVNRRNRGKTVTISTLNYYGGTELK